VGDHTIARSGVDCEVDEVITINVHDGLEPVIGIIVTPAGYPHLSSP